MKLTYGETLPEGVYNLVLCDGTSTSATILEKFDKKYGYLPTRVVIGEGVVGFDAEDWGLEIHSTGKKVQPKHIMLR